MKIKMKEAMGVMAKALANAGNGKLPCHDAKARFPNGTKVELRDLFFNALIFTGVVTGSGTDEYGEYQEINITSPKERKGLKRVRLMDLEMLREVK